ncbi:MAG: hypothetical protein AB8B66_02365 [Rickettsiaceae bacterium]
MALNNSIAPFAISQPQYESTLLQKGVDDKMLAKHRLLVKSRAPTKEPSRDLF